jgi:hypothetical protein
LIFLNSKKTKYERRIHDDLVLSVLMLIYGEELGKPKDVFSWFSLKKFSIKYRDMFILHISEKLSSGWFLSQFDNLYITLKKFIHENPALIATLNEEHSNEIWVRITPTRHI